MNWIRELKTQTTECEQSKAQLNETVKQLMFEKEQLRNQMNYDSAPGVELDLDGNYQTRESLDTPEKRRFAETYNPSNKDSKSKLAYSLEYSPSVKAPRSFASAANQTMNGDRFYTASSPIKKKIDESYTQEMSRDRARELKSALKKRNREDSSENKSFENLNKSQKEGSDALQLSFGQENEPTTEDLLKKVTKKLRDLNVMAPSSKEYEPSSLTSKYTTQSVKNEAAYKYNRSYDPLLSTQGNPKIPNFEKVKLHSQDECG